MLCICVVYVVVKSVNEICVKKVYNINFFG